MKRLNEIYACAIKALGGTSLAAMQSLFVSLMASSNGFHSYPCRDPKAQEPLTVSLQFENHWEEWESRENGLPQLCRNLVSEPEQELRSLNCQVFFSLLSHLYSPFRSYASPISQGKWGPEGVLFRASLWSEYRLGLFNQTAWVKTLSLSSSYLGAGWPWADIYIVFYIFLM